MTSTTLRRRRRLGLWLLALLLLVLLVVARARHPQEHPTIAASMVAPARAPVTVAPGRPRQPAAPEPPEPPVIDEIIVEKPRVCEGEETLVTVRAHAPASADTPLLHGVIQGEPGMSVPVRLYRGKHGEPPGPVEVLVFGRDNQVAMAQAPPIEVLDCVAEHVVAIDSRLRSNTIDELELRARVVPLGAGTHFDAVRWRWRVGGDAPVETEAPWTRRSFAERAQDTLFSYVPVEVEAEDAEGKRVSGRATVTLHNLAYANLAGAGVVTILAGLEPRFPELDARGVVRQHVRFFHHRPEPVRVTRVVARRNFLARGRAPEESPVPVVSLLGGTDVPPGGLSVALELDTRAEPELFSIDYLLEGESAEGWPARGVVSLMRPSARPTRAASDAVLDPALVERIRRARKLLGQDLVSDEDIWALERDGAFADLAAEGQGGRDLTHADLPRHPPRVGEPADPAATPLPVGEDVPVGGR